tara:strand:+ start:378 stop:962 length:585 start_codon:yes stop_codon:yes gene_type:complete
MTTRVDGGQIKDGDITEAKLQTLINPVAEVSNNAFNIGVLGFKVAVNNGLTVFNLVDGVVDEFHDNTGVDTSESSNATYDASADTFSNSTTSMTLISDTFTANTTPSTARIVLFAELPDGTSDFTISATRDNTTFNNITLTDEGYQAGSSGIKIFSGSTSLTGSSSPQVQVRWKIVGSSLSGTNKIHGVSLQWK